jgi:raffinose/stachyose/melibiose transport system permease protein
MSSDARAAAPAREGDALEHVVARRRSTGRARTSAVMTHAVLIAYTLVALGPIALIVMNSFKERRAIFSEPFTPPTAETFSLVGYESVLERGDFGTYFLNSFLVTFLSVLLVVLLSSMAAFALTEYRFRLANPLLLLFALGIMIPIRLGTVSILRIMVELRLVNSLTALIIVYTAMGLPLAVVLMSQFMRQTPTELKEAARVDGAGELRVYRMVLPLVRPGLAAVAVVSMLPVWNDLWFPLVLAPSRATTTVTLGVQQFVGQYVTNWNAVLAALTLGSLPLILLFVIFSRQFISGLSAGVGK